MQDHVEPDATATDWRDRAVLHATQVLELQELLMSAARDERDRWRAELAEEMTLPDERSNRVIARSIEVTEALRALLPWVRSDIDADSPEFAAYAAALANAARAVQT